MATTRCRAVEEKLRRAWGDTALESQYRASGSSFLLGPNAVLATKARLLGATVAVKQATNRKKTSGDRSDAFF